MSKWFAFRPERDDFTPTALDCSHCVEKPAGQHGFVGVDGERFVYQDGTEARFWGAQLGLFDKPEMDYAARRLRKQGINMVRYHGLEFLQNRDGSSVFDYSHEGFDRLDYAIYRLGQEGIYLILDVDYYLRLRTGDGIEGLPDRERTPYLMFFNDDVAKIKRRRMTDVFTRRNPYTGLRYSDDPSVAMVEVCNEDSMFWYGVSRLSEPFASQLAERFKKWLRRRYGGQRALQEAWTADGVCALGEGEGLSPSATLGMMAMWEFSERGLREHPERETRGMDQLRFFLDLERRYFQSCYRHLRKIGVKVPISATNWKGGGFSTRVHMRGQAELDYIDRHGYWDHPQGEGNTKWRIATCRLFNLPMIKAVTAGHDAQQENNVGNLVLSKAWERVLGKPMSISEWNTCLPNEYSLEGTGLMAAYGLLQGWNAPLQFGCFSSDYPRKLGRGSFDMMGNPPQILQYPAVMRMWHRRDIKEGPLVAETLYGPDEEFEYREDRRPLPMMAACIGKVGYRFAEKPRKPVVRDIRRYWDEDTLTARSITGELSWNATAGVVTIDTARTFGAIGFLARGPHTFKAGRIKSSTRFGAVYVTSLEDSRSLRSAKRILVSAVGRARNTNMEYATARDRSGVHGVTLQRLSRVGRAPVLLEAIVGEVRIRTRHASALRAWALDPNGKRKAEVRLTVDAGEVVLRLRAACETVYYELAPV
jgi:glycosyl hydrolase family 42 (putative beta-galactosidase)